MLTGIVSVSAPNSVASADDLAFRLCNSRLLTPLFCGAGTLKGCFAAGDGTGTGCDTAGFGMFSRINWLRARLMCARSLFSVQRVAVLFRGAFCISRALPKCRHLMFEEECLAQVPNGSWPQLSVPLIWRGNSIRNTAPCGSREATVSVP